jgi:hypothetical protein
MEEGLGVDRLLIPALLQRDFPSRFGHHHIVRVQLAVADDPNILDIFDLLADQL